MHYIRGIEVRRRLFWVAAVRAVLCLFVAGVMRLNRHPAADVEGLLPYAVVAATFLVNLACIALGAAGIRPRLVVSGQMWLDVVMITALVYLTGGVGSDFLLLYFGPILAAGVSSRRSVALLVGSLAAIGLFFCAAAYAMPRGGPPLVEQLWIAEGRPQPGALVGVLALHGTAFHLVAFLSSTLALRLRSASIHTEQILENMSDGVITVDNTARVVFSNTVAAKMLELEGEESLVGRPFRDVAPGPAWVALQTVISSAASRTVEVRIGQRGIPALATVLPLTNQAGRLRGANVILHDLTERHRLVEALRRAERLEATAATVASIAHEIRNPLAAIRGSAQELKNALDLGDPDRRLMDLVVDESDRLNRVLTDFLNFSRMPKPQIAPTELRGLLEEVAAQLAVCPAGKAARIEVRGDEQLRIAADGEQLRQVFLNLGLNAIDATAGAGRLVFHLESDDDGIVVKTLDEGCGVDPAIGEQIFEPFFTTKTTGTGLGLSIARRIVEEHGGALELADGEPGWTCVKVFLPFAEAKAEPARSEERSVTSP